MFNMHNMLSTVLPLISLFLVITTSLIGIYSIVSVLSKKMFDEEKNEKFPISVLRILPVAGNGENIEWQVNALLKTGNDLAILDNGLDENGRKICGILCEKKSGLTIFTRDTIHKLFENLQL